MVGLETAVRGISVVPTMIFASPGASYATEGMTVIHWKIGMSGIAGTLPAAEGSSNANLFNCASHPFMYAMGTAIVRTVQMS